MEAKRACLAYASLVLIVFVFSILIAVFVQGQWPDRKGREGVAFATCAAAILFLPGLAAVAKTSKRP